jgi:hypothetical protein
MRGVRIVPCEESAPLGDDRPHRPVKADHTAPRHGTTSFGVAVHLRSGLRYDADRHCESSPTGIAVRCRADSRAESDRTRGTSPTGLMVRVRADSRVESERTRGGHGDNEPLVMGNYEAPLLIARYCLFALRTDHRPSSSIANCSLAGCPHRT